MVDAPAGESAVIHGAREMKRLPMKGLSRRLQPFDTVVERLYGRRERTTTVPSWRPPEPRLTPWATMRWRRPGDDGRGPHTPSHYTSPRRVSPGRLA